MIYDISYKTLTGPKPLRIKFHKIDGFIRIYDGTRYLTLFSSENYDAIYNRIRYRISLKSSITYNFSHYFAKIKFDSYDSLPIEKRLILHNVVILMKPFLNMILHNVAILMKPVLNKDRSHYYCRIFLEKCSYQLA